MREFVTIADGDSAEYERFVSEHGSFPQAIAWGDFRAPLHANVFRYALVDGGKFLMTVQVFQSSALGRPYLYAPYGPVVADAADVAYAAELFSELVKGICARHPRAIFLRTEPRFSLGDESTKWGRASLNVSPHQTLALDLTKTLDQLLAQMHSKTRYNVHLAEKHGVEVAVEDSVSDAAGELLLETSRRAGIRAHATGYYKNLVEKLRGTAITAKVYCAYHGGELLAANVVLRYGDTSVYLFGGSSAHQRNVMAPYILQWRAIADAQAAGATAYDFWGVETDPTHPWAGFSRFKLGFGGEIETFAGTRDYVFSPAWYNAYRSLRNLARKIRK